MLQAVARRLWSCTLPATKAAVVAKPCRTLGVSSADPCSMSCECVCEPFLKFVSICWLLSPCRLLCKTSGVQLGSKSVSLGSQRSDTPFLLPYLPLVSHGHTLVLFPGPTNLQSLIACNMQIHREKAWEIWPRAVMSGRYRHR